MRRSLVLLLTLGWSAAASAEAPYAQWERLRNPDALAIDFNEGSAFLAAHPGWPEEKLIRLRTEAAALNERPAKPVMEKFCTDFPPISGRGRIACAMATVGSAEQQKEWIQQGWRLGDFNADEETRIRTHYATTLSKADHHARMERLLYEGSTKAAKRMMPLVDSAKHAVYQVRIAFANNETRAPRMFEKLSMHDRATTGITFERLRWRERHNSDDYADLLKLVPKDAPYPELWWPFRVAVARDAIAKAQYDTAFAALKHTGELKGEALADALWLRGWILLRHKNNAGEAYKQFFKLYTSVSTPVSKARAAYWAARAAEKNGNADIAHEWWEKAARHTTVFYGQLAHQKLHPDTPLHLPAPIPISTETQQKLDASELAAAARTLAKKGDEKTRDVFLAALANNATKGEEFAAIATLARDIGGINTAVDIAKLALRDGIVIFPHGWPTITTPNDLPIEPALTLAITRQESEFDPRARSSADARGLMQLLPSTARQVAKKLSMNFQERDLETPDVNLTLGSNYLGRIIRGFDGSYILGIASYNAGPANVRKWIARRGTPPKNLEGAIDWIESIPFGETRNYVMRALENVSVYRTLADPHSALMIEKDLLR